MVTQIVFPSYGKSAELAVENRSAKDSSSRMIKTKKKSFSKLTLSGVRLSVASNLFGGNTSSHRGGKDGRDCLREVSCDL